MKRPSVSKMEYQALIARLAEITGSNEDTVRSVLGAFPGVIMEGDIGERTRTPLGVFTLTERKQSKPVMTPTGHWGSAKPMVLARLKPGTRLRRDPSEPSDSSSTGEDPLK
jgi:hypothetical protein